MPKKPKMFPCGCCYDLTYEERYAKHNSYHIGDEDSMPYRKKRGGSNRKYCKRAKEPKTPHDFTKKVPRWGYSYDRLEKKYVKVETVGFVCSKCGKPERRSFWF